MPAATSAHANSRSRSSSARRKISISVAAKGTISESRKLVDLEISNSGNENARQLSLGLPMRRSARVTGSGDRCSMGFPTTGVRSMKWVGDFSRL
jgi:hypothetical protein